MKLKPLRKSGAPGYPGLVRGALRSVLAAASMSATALGGCGPGLDSRDLDTALDDGDLDGTVDECEAGEDGAACPDSSDTPSTP